MKKILIALAATTALAAPALAADLGRPVYKAPVAVMEPVGSWNGFYLGVHGGYGSGDSRFDFATPGFYNTAAGDSFTHSMRGGLIGGHVGYNWQFGATVFGLEASGTWSDVKRNNVTSPFFPGSDQFSTQVEWISTFTPRLGYAGSNWLLYVKGGLAVARVEATIQDNVNAGTTIDARSNTKTGWTVGGGLEYMMASNWVVGVEGNYYDFGYCCGGLRQSALQTTGGPAGVFSTHRVKTDMWSVLGRVSYKFGGGPIVAAY